VAQLEYFVTDEGGSRGPLPAEALREALGAGSGVLTRVRVEGCEPWLPVEAWERFADLRPAPPVPPPPAAGPATRLPPELAGIAPSVRDKLLWFVLDADGVMGPVSGEFVRRGLATGKLKMGAGICLVGSTGWVRASIGFPSALEGATAVRPRPLTTFPCPACLEPCASSDAECGACGEPVIKARRAPSLGVAIVLVALAWIIVLGVAVGAGAIARTKLGAISLPSALGTT
jgi:hypothetical protein